MKLILVWVFAVVFLFDSIYRIFRTNFNLGNLMMILIAVMLWCYALFHAKIDAFCAAGFGRFLKITFFTGCTVMVFLMAFIAFKGHSAPVTYQEDAVIVLGAGIRGERVTKLLARRLDAAYEYHLKNPDAVIVVSGGQGPGESIAESLAMKRYLTAKGVPEDQILRESESKSTEENFLFSRPVLEKAGISCNQPIAFVTNDFHCYRSAKYAAAAGFENVRAIPAPIGISSVLPCYMREVLAVLFYWVFRR